MYTLLEDFFYLSVLLTIVPVLAICLTGLVSAVLQAATQVQEQSLSFLSRLVTLVFILIFFGPGMMGVIEDYARNALLGMAP